MRHFSDSRFGKGVFYTILSRDTLSGLDFDEATILIGGERVSVLRELVGCLQISDTDVVKHLDHEPNGLSPAEAQVLNEFFSFRQSVVTAFSSNAGGSQEDPFAGSFFYVNLNTGKSVSWIVYLEV